MPLNLNIPLLAQSRVIFISQDGFCTVNVNKRSKLVYTLNGVQQRVVACLNCRQLYYEQGYTTQRGKTLSPIR